jgi:hypothetical protein
MWLCWALYCHLIFIVLNCCIVIVASLFGQFITKLVLFQCFMLLIYISQCMYIYIFDIIFFFCAKSSLYTICEFMLTCIDQLAIFFLTIWNVNLCNILYVKNIINQKLFIVLSDFIDLSIMNTFIYSTHLYIWYHFSSVRLDYENQFGVWLMFWKVTLSECLCSGYIRNTGSTIGWVITSYITGLWFDPYFCNCF